MFWRKFRFHLLAGMLVVVGGINIALMDNQAVAVNATPRLYAGLAVGSPSGAMVVGDGQEVLKFNLTAVGADFEIRSVSFRKTGACQAIGKGEATLRNMSDMVNPVAVLPAGKAWFSNSLVAFNSSSFIKPLVVTKDSSIILSLRGDTTGCKGKVVFTIPYVGISAQYLKPASFAVGNVNGEALFYSTPPVATSSLRATLAPSSPAGASVPGLNEILRFTLAVSGNDDIKVKSLNFKPATTCQQIINPAASLYDSFDLATPIKIWNWTDKNDFINGFSAGDLNKVIAAVQSKTFVVKFDTTGCSSARDEKFRLDLTGGTWQTDSPNRPASGTIAGTPVQGGTIVY